MSPHDMPRFSIALPTRDRPKLLKIAVQTLLRQTFQDWELVLSDKSTNEDTRAMVVEFDDPRIRYFRADDLSMCDNWEFACSHARGEYICVLEDKQAFKFHALERINQVIHERKPEVIRWQWDTLDPYGLGNRVRRNGARGGVRTVTADKCLEALVDGSYMEAKHQLPIAHYSAVHRDVLKRIRAGAIGRLFPPVSPDYTLALQILNFSEEVTYIHEGLVCFSDTSASNGLSIRMKATLGNSFAKSLGGDHVFY
ncbi:MAG: hypothetical protein ACI9F9_000477 [Candidatus Paceibacteria bacterium]|jgi:hypothetical protein